MANKTTKREYFEMIRGIVEASNHEDKTGILAMIDKEMELLSNKTAKSGKRTKEANELLQTIALEVIADFARPVTITELMQDTRLSTYKKPGKENTYSIEPMTNQKLSAILKPLVDSHRVIKTIEKKKAYFSLPKGTDATEQEQE